jgi:hypothetical protein
MTTQRFNRSEVLSYFDLTPTQQVNAVSNYYQSTEEAEQDNFVLISEEHSPLPLSMFMRQKVGLWDGVYGTSYFSAYFIKLSRCGTMAVVAERTW